VETSPITIQFGGAPSELLQERVIPALEGGSPFNFRLEKTSSGQVVFAGLDLFGGAEAFRWMVFASAPFSGGLDAEGYPKPQPFQFEAPTVLEFFGGSSMSRAEGMASGSVQPR
jgi:hypothetical protein